jgi:hypothetical protein
LGTLLARRGETEAAFQHFRMASPDVATAHNNLAVALLESGELEQSRDELVKALTARYYFAAPMQNFKLVQELLSKRTDMINAGSHLPLTPLRIPPSLATAAISVIPFESNARSPQSQGAPDSHFSEEPK